MKFCERRKVAELQAKKCLSQEISIMKRVNGHPNIVRLYEVVDTPQHVVLVMEFAAVGDLLRYVRQRQKLNESCAQDLFKQLLDGVFQIHRNNVVHRDLKLENVLLDAFGCLKIADFGVAAVLKKTGQRLTEHCGTPSYIAPEILTENGGYEGFPVDIWSSGVVLYAMLCGRVPFKGEHLGELKRNIIRGKFTLPAFVSESATELLHRVLAVNPKQRATLEETLGHRWLDGIANRAETLFGTLWNPYPDDCAWSIPAHVNSKELIDRVVNLGFPSEHVETSVKEGKLNHATATFQLLLQQAVKKRLSIEAQDGTVVTDVS